MITQLRNGCAWSRKIRVDISACSPFSSFLLQKMMLAMHRGSPIARQARLLLGFCQRSKSTQFLKTSNQVCGVLKMSKLSIGERGKLLSQVDIGRNIRSLQVGIVWHEKGENSSNDAEDKFKDDKFKDDPDVRGILTDIKSHFDQSDKGVNVPAEPNNEEAVVNENESESKTTSIKSNLQFSSSDLSKQFEVWSHLVIEVLEDKMISGISLLLIGDGIS